jgi:hypothetical protein
MMHFPSRFNYSPRSPEKSQTRLLWGLESSYLCATPGCAIKAIGAHKNKVYCTAHFSAALRQQWQE